MCAQFLSSDVSLNSFAPPLFPVVIMEFVFQGVKSLILTSQYYSIARLFSVLHYTFISTKFFILAFLGFIFMILKKTLNNIFPIYLHIFSLLDCFIVHPPKIYLLSLIFSFIIYALRF